MKINLYSCKICRSRGKTFSGTRVMVRKHLREEHLVRGKQKISGVIEPSMLSANMIVEEIK